MMLHVANVFFEASIVRDSRADAMHNDVRAFFNLLEIMLSLLPSVSLLMAVSPSSPPKRPCLSPAAAVVVTVSPCMLSVDNSGDRGGMAAKAILAQKMTSSPNADANRISGKV